MFHSFQYVDDAIVPCASQGDVVAIVNKTNTSACSVFAKQTKSQFHYSPAKTSCLPLFDCPPVQTEGLDCDIVQEKLILGVLVGSQLSFAPLLRWALKHGWETFVSFLYAVESRGFSLPVLAAQTETRIVSKLMHLAPFLCLAPGAYHKLNRLQWNWGKMLLGVRDQVEIRIRLPLGGSRLEIGLEVWVGHGNQRALQSVAFSHRRSLRQHGMHQPCAKEYCKSIAT